MVYAYDKSVIRYKKLKLFAIIKTNRGSCSSHIQAINKSWWILRNFETTRDSPRYPLVKRIKKISTQWTPGTKIFSKIQMNYLNLTFPKTAKYCLAMSNVDSYALLYLIQLSMNFKQQT